MNIRKGNKSNHYAPAPRTNLPKQKSTTGRTFVLLKQTHNFPAPNFFTTNIIPPVIENEHVELTDSPKRKNTQPTSFPVARVDEAKRESTALFVPIPAAVTQTKPKKAKKKQDDTSLSINELMQQTEQERLANRNITNQPEIATSQSSSSSSFYAPKANGYNARKRNNQLVIASQQATSSNESPRRKR